MNRDLLIERTKKFAHKCVKLTMELPKTQLGKHICDQLIRSSTSVAANYRAACLGQSRASFISKISIVIEEVDETGFWLEFIIDENLINDDQIKMLLQESKELTSIFIKTRITAKKSNKSNNK